MSTTTSTTAQPVPPQTTEPMAKLMVALGYQVVFLAMLLVAYLTKDQNMLTLLGGAAIGMAVQGGNYFLGSSSGSDRKTELLAASTPPTTPGVGP